MRSFVHGFIFFAFFFFVNAEESDIVIKVSDGLINWSEGTVVVTGSGTPELNISNANSARLFSEKVAYKNAGYRFQKILADIRLDGSATISEFLEKRKEIAFETPLVEAKQAEKVGKRTFSDGSVDIKLKFLIVEYIAEICKRYREELQKNLVLTKVVRNLPVDEKVLFSKLVVEVNKKKYSPVLFPRMVTGDGKLIYGLEKHRPDLSCGKLVKYLGGYSEKDALYIIADKITEKGEIVLSDNDELKVKTQLKDGVLKNGNVLIVLK